MTYLFNIRLGHACNSSSTHSIVPLDQLLKFRGVMEIQDENVTTGQYGWDKFVLASEQEKMTYLSLQMHGSGVDPELREQFTGIASDTLNGDWDYIDHQAMFSLPTDQEFLTDLAAYLRRDDVIVLGGNDNGGAPDLDGHFPWKSFGPSIAARSDHHGDLKYWTLMDTCTGNKVRFSFENESALVGHDLPKHTSVVSYASAPELVDLKITGYCPFSADCPMCYMGSDRAGEHADYDYLMGYLSRMAEAGVFEVAMGGGEPTLHPRFFDLLREGSELGLAMNFTTKNFAYFKPGKKLYDIRQYARAVAFSVNSRADLDKMRQTVQHLRESRALTRSWWKEDSPGHLDVTLQTIPAMHGPQFLRELLAYCVDERVRITLLGFKRIGRGATHPVDNPNQRWVDTLSEMITDKTISPWQLRSLVAIDTLMAAECKPLFDEAGIDPRWYHTQEGAFSCYIDGVTGKLGESSYIPETEMQAYGPEEDLALAFQAMQTQRGIRS